MQNVLLVEDDELISDLYSTVLELGGFKVDRVADSTTVLQRVTEIEVDLIVLDLMMPLMSGMQVLEKLKADETYRNIPVIMFSNLLDPAASEEAIQKGALRYALKSDYPPRAFISLIKEVLASEESEEKKAA
jgi:adenylate cyclase